MQSITLSDEVLSRDAERGFYVKGERAETATTGPLKDRQLEDVLIQMHGDVSPQLIREVVQELRMCDRCNELWHRLVIRGWTVSPPVPFFQFKMDVNCLSSAIACDVFWKLINYSSKGFQGRRTVGVTRVT